jgi:hypothetical protein
MPRDEHSPLKSLHSRESLIPSKLAVFEQWSTEALSASLAASQKDCLKARPDGNILDGHHRIYVLRNRGVDADALDREIVIKTEFQNGE